MPTITYQQHQIHYHQYGEGKKLMLGFHGFADKGDLFERVAGVLEADYTTIAIDMPFHGETLWEGDIYHPDDVLAIVQLLLKQYEATSFSVMCHSMGARVLWGILPLLANQIETIYCFAPAGFQYTFTASRFWFPLWFRTRCRNRFEHSKGALRFFELTHRLKLMNRATYLVFKQQLDLPRRRARLLKTWMAMYYFPMGPKDKHAQLINQEGIQTYFFYGKKDRITPAKFAYKFIEKLQKVELILVKGNHFLVRETVVHPFKEWYKGQTSKP